MHNKVIHTTLYEARMRWEGTHERGGGAEVESGSGGGRCRRWSHHSGGRRNAHHPSSYCSLQHNTSLLSSVLSLSNYTKTTRMKSQHMIMKSQYIIICQVFVFYSYSSKNGNILLLLRRDRPSVTWSGYVGLTPHPPFAVPRATRLR